MKLVVGDPHVTPDDLDDARTMVDQIAEVVKSHQIKTVLFMGDLYDTHDTLSSRVVDFWLSSFDRLNKIAEVAAIVGNHDQVSPTNRYPHSLQIHEHNVKVFSSSGRLDDLSVVMPYFHSPQLFVESAKILKEHFPSATTLFCHQTFQGARYENGFYAKDAVELMDVPFEHIYSGHIHSTQKMGNRCLYVGSPRWRTASDVGVDKFLWVLDTNNAVSHKIQSKTRRVWRIRDDSDTPYTKHLDRVRPGDVVHIDVHRGSELEAKKRQKELIENGYKAHAHFESKKNVQVSESVGIVSAFEAYFESFEPPHKTPKTELEQALGERL